MSSIIYYQNSLDGRCAAAVAMWAKASRYALPTNFGYQPNFSKLQYGDYIYLLGVLWDFNAMTECNNRYRLIYIDHHESSLKDCHERKFKARNAIQDTSVSTCVSTWKYFFPDDLVPKALLMISEHTLGSFDNPDVINFVEGLNTFNTRPDSELWPALFAKDPSATISNVQSRGEEVQQFSNLYNKKIRHGCIYETELLGYKCLAVNYRTFDHRFFTDYLNDLKDKSEKYDLLLMYTFRGFDGQYKVTVFSNNGKLDLTEILPRLHGGGQKAVGAFSCTELPFKENRLDIEPFKFDENEYLNSHLIVRQYKLIGDRACFNQCNYFEVISGLNCGIINTPEVSKSFFNFISPMLPSLDLGICWSWDNRGQYKITIFPLNGKLTQDGVIKFIMNLGFEGGAKINDDGITFFVDSLPFNKEKRNESILLIK